MPAGPEIRAILLNKAPKFGNDDERADKWVVELEDYIGSSYRYKYRSSKYGKGPVPCCYSYSQSPVTGNIAFGKSIGATPDGRKDGQPVNNGISPANGSEKKGATAACKSGDSAYGSRKGRYSTCACPKERWIRMRIKRR